MELTSGTQVSQHVRLVRQLGHGGMGFLWVGWDERFETEVAVKFIARDLLLRHPNLRDRFLTEAKAAAKLRSPHVVHILDHGETADGTPYIVMELLDGEGLGDRLRRERFLPPDEVAEITDQAAKALSAAHAKGIVHRDIKPDNIFLSKMDHDYDEIFVKVLDFGIAKVLGNESGHGTEGMLGTPTYMSPEQLLLAKAVDSRADIWALTCVVYEMLTGHEPFSGETSAARILAVTKHHFDLPSVHGVEGFDALFCRAFHRDIDTRFASARELADEVRRLCSSMEPQTPAVAPRPGSSDADTEPSPGRRRAASGDASQTTVAEGGAGAAVPGEGSRQGRPSAAMDEKPPSALQGTPSSAQPARPTDAGATTSPSSSPRRMGRGVAIGLGSAVVALGVGAVLWAGIESDSGSERAQPTGSATVASSSPATPPSATPAPAPEPEPPPEPPKGMVAVPGGSYRIGCEPERHTSCFDDEQPPHIVELMPFAIMKHEVTMEAYDQCIADEACPEAGKQKRCTWQRPGHEDHPINCIGLAAAQAYCAQQGWRLPSEAEWEVAARGKGTPPHPWGDASPSCERTVMRSSEGDGCGSEGPLPVGSKPNDRSWVGALDMGGNVREWTSTPYGPYPGGKAEPGRSGQVNRGGSYALPAERFGGSFTRYVDGPDTARPTLGFRCAVSL